MSDPHPTPAPTHRQHPLFSDDYQAQADAWIAANPAAFAAFITICKAHAQRGERFGAKGVCERLRWDPQFEPQRRVSTQPGGFAINNNHVSYILRRAIDHYPHLADYVVVRKAHKSIAADAARTIRRAV